MNPRKAWFSSHHKEHLSHPKPNLAYRKTMKTNPKLSQQKFCHLEGGWSDHHWNKVPPHWIFHAWVSTINSHASDKSLQHQPLKKLSLESFNKATIRDASWPFLQSSQKPLCCGSFWPGPKTLRSSTSQRPPSRVNHLEQSAVPWGGQLRHFWDKSIL